jgi:outer membrane biosynthesis protein TonB
VSSPDLDRITGNPALQKVLARALDRDRNRRFATAREFSDALAAIESTLPDEPPAAPAPFDADATMKTQRTIGGQTIAPPSADAPPTIITSTPPPPPIAPPVTRQATVPARPAPPPPPPPAPDAPPTVVDPMPMPPPAPRRNTGTIIAVSIIVLLLLGAMGVAGVMAFMKFRNFFGGTSATTASTTTTTPITAKPSQTSVDVTPPTSVLVDTATTSATTTTAAPVTTSSAAVVQPPTATRAPVKPKPAVVEEPPPPIEETASPEPQPEPEPATSSVPTFRERGDGSANDAAVAALRQQIAGATRVAVSGGDAEMINELSNALRGRGISIGEGAPIEIRFTGSVARHGLGRKSRSANATVKKNGRPIFNYVMPREDYRVGDSPAEAFARILTDALSR